MEVKEILDERKATHGDFTENARIAQELKRVAESAINWDTMNDVQREGVHAILCKLSRVLSGGVTYKDTWQDIQGYAKLVEERLPKEDIDLLKSVVLC